MLAKLFLAKYPFVGEAADRLRRLELTLDSLSEPTYDRPLARAEERLEQAISNGIVAAASWDDEVELLSFPIATLLVAMLQDDRVTRRYALAESKRASHLLASEEGKILCQVASSAFRWDIKAEGDVSKPGVAFQLNFATYIRNVARLQDSKWKLTNRQLDKGYVRVTKEDAARLLEEEIQARILRIVNDSKVEEPEFLKERVDRIRALATEKMGQIYSEELPNEVISAAMPPCMKKIYDLLCTGKQVPHVGRFALTSFLVNVGAKEEDILRIYKAASDFDEGKTRYQVEHIAGSRGGKTKYTPPKCSTLKTHGLCVSNDVNCSDIRHPLTFYRRRVRHMLKRVPTDSGN